MAKKSSLFKTLTTIIATTALTLTVATGIVVGHTIKDFVNQPQEKEKRDVDKIEKTNSYGLIDEYTITYSDGTTSTFIVANNNGEYGVNTFPGTDGYIPDVKVGENGTFIVDGVDTGVAVQRMEPQNPRSILSIEKTETDGLIDTYAIIYSDNTTSTFIVVNGADGPQGIQGLPGENGATPTISINAEGYWVINGEATTFKAEGKAGTGLLTGDGEPNQTLGNLYDSYIDTTTWNYYVKENGVWVLKGNLMGTSGANGTTPHIGPNGNWWIDQTDTGVAANGHSGSSVTTGHGNPNGDNTDPNNPVAAKEGVAGDTYIDLDTGNVYVKDENGWQVDPNGAAGIHGTTPHVGANGNWWIGETDTGIAAQGPQGPAGQAGASILTGSSAPTQELGNNNDSYIDTSSWNYYVKENNVWVFKGNIQGAQGQDGNSLSITSCVKTGENGLIDTYTITFSNGDTATFAVVNGAAGQPGQAGQNGANGNDGHTPVITIGANGNWYVDGVDTGATSKGQQGQQGEAGNGISSIVITNSTATSTTYRITFTNGSHFDYSVANGTNGQDGTDGTCMRTGEVDPASDLGKNGDSYINTVTWDYFVKENDVWVFKGNIKGATGATGAAGASGSNGSNGSNGENGVSVVSIVRTAGNGAAGTVDTYTITYSDNTTSTFTVTNGADGTDGNTILVAIGAPTSATGGADGDSYIDSSTWNYYLKVAGNWELQGNIKGAKGDNGRGIASITKTGPAADGLTYTYTVTYTDSSEPFVFNVTNGKNGTNVLTGPTNPTIEGFDGDSYINTTNWDYFVKENGSWVKKGNIKGVSIVSIIRTDGNGAPGTVDTYTITYSDATTSTFTVTNGANGTDGQDGKKLITDTGAPNGALGNVGDSYIDVSSWTLYIKTAEDTWTSKGSFKGADGADGQNGQDGTSVSITDITTSGTGEAGTSDTYTVTFSDGNSLVITVYNGKNGNSLLTGSDNPTTQGVDGDSYINTTSWEYFFKVSGVWTSKGIIKGNDGTSVTSGSGVPDNNDGQNGDSYIDLATWTFYVKENDAWVEHGNIHNELDKYDVSFNLSYDSDSDGINDTYTSIADVEHGHNINTDKPADPSRDGWIFQGWYTAQGTKWDFEKDVITGDITLYARWAKFKVVDGVLTECTATGDVVIPEFFDGQFITSIGDNVFKNNAAITSVTLPSTVKSIGNSAFEGCSNLTSIIIPSSVETIGNDAFKGCSNLAYVYTNGGNRANGGLKTIGEGAFENCTSLKNLVIPSTVTSIGDNAFKGCNALESLSLPYIPNDTGTTVTATWSTGHGEPALDYTASTVYMDEDTYIVYARTDANDPWSVVFDQWNPSSLKFCFVDGVPNDGDHTDEVGAVNRLNGDLYVWDSDHYQLYVNFLTFPAIGVAPMFVGLPSNSRAIGTLFGVNNNELPSSLKTIVINGNNAIPDHALDGCTHIENIVVSGNPSSIGASAFAGCTSLKTITLPYIGGISFDPDSELTYSYGHGEPAADYDISNVYLDLDTTDVWQYVNGSWVKKIVWASVTSDDVYVGSGAPSSAGNTNDIYIDYLTGELYGYNGSWSVQTRITELNQMGLLDSPSSVNSAYIGYVFGASDYASQATNIPASLKTIVLTGANGKNGDEISQGAFANLTTVETIVLPKNLNKIQTNAFAQIEMDSFVVPDSVTYIAENAFYRARITHLTIPFTGTAKANGLQELGAVFGNYHKYIETIVLTGGNGINGNKISNSAFQGCTALTSISLPEGITYIDDNAFRNCSSLTSIILPYGVTYIGDYAFGSCTNLNYVSLPSTLTTIDDFAFDNCSSLEYIVLPEGLRTIAWYSFSHTGLKSIVIPSSVTRIGADAFSFNSNLTSFVALDGCDIIVESGAFDSCTNLKYVKFECAISSFGYCGGDWLLSYWNPFDECDNLEYVNLGRDLLAPSEEADASQTPFYILESRSGSGQCGGTFEDCANLKTVVLPNTITEIQSDSFKGCSSLVSVNLPTGLTTIGNRAFAYCSSLTAISVPETVTFIGKGAFEVAKKWVHYGNLKDSYSPNATSIVVDEFANRTTSGTDGDIYICNDSDHFGHIYVRNGTGNNWILKDTIYFSFAFGAVNPAANTASSTEVNVLFINTNTGELTINCASKLQSISVPFIGRDNGSDTSFNYFAYIFGADFYAQSYIRLPYTLKTVIINNSENIISNAFYKCYCVETIVIKGRVQNVGNNTFNACYSLKNISLPESVTNIGMLSFSLCVSLKNVALPSHVKTIGYSAFSHCASLETIYLPDGLTTIGREAFFDDTSLKSVYLPDTVTSIDICAFQECTALESFRLSSNLETISQQMFYGCTALKSIVIPANTLRIDHDAFNGCSGLNYVFFEEGVRVIHQYAFQNCTSLTSIVLPNSVKDLGRGVFYGCTSLESISLPFAGASYSSMGQLIGDDSIEIGGKPSDSVGNDNDLLVDTVNDKILRKVDGKWYSQLQFIHVGESQPGDITFGHGVPTPASGNSFYADLDSLDFYEIDPVDPNVWHKIGNLNSLFGKFAYVFVGPNGNGSFDTFNNDTLASLKNVAITKGAYDQALDRYFIQEDSFMGCADIENISLPKDVYTIDDNAFKGCTSLKTVIFGNNAILESFGRDAFKGCSNLTSIVIPNGVVYIFDNAFMDCTSLKYVAFQDNSHVETIYKQAFANCTSLESIIIPSSVTELQIGCFQGCSSLKSISLPFVGSNATSNEYAYLGHIFGANSYSGNNTYTPASLKTVEVTGNTDLGGYAFYNCQNVEAILISGNPSQIGNNAFKGTNSLKTLKIPYVGKAAEYTTGSYCRLEYVFDYNLSSTLETIILTGANGVNHDVIPEYAFAGFSAVKNYILPENVTTFSTSCFQNNDSLETFVIPDSVTTLGNSAFYSCDNLTYIKIGAGITSIGTSAFGYCSKLDNVSIPSNVTSIGNEAFRSCIGLRTINIENGLLSIGQYAFAYCDSLQAIFLPSSLTTIDRYAFNQCKSLMYVDSSSCGSLAALGDYAFAQCSLLSTVILSSSIKTIGEYCFNQCSALQIIDTKFVETFGRYSFKECSALISANFRFFTKIDEYAFQNCTSLSYVYFYFGNDTVRSIERYAFTNCVSLKSVNLGEKSARLAKLGNSAFNGCTGLESFVIPYLGDTVDNPCYLSEITGYDAASNIKYVSVGDAHAIRDGAFQGLRSLETVYISGSNCTRIGDEVFRSCRSLKTVSLPLCDYYGKYMCYNCDNLISFDVGSVNGKSWTHIPDYCFYGCTSLSNISLLSTKSFGDYAFYGCISLTEIRVWHGNGIETIGDYAFANCINLSTFNFKGGNIVNKFSRIGEYAFQNCAFTSLTLPANDHMSIGRGAFADCSKLRYVYLEEGISSIGGYAFANCPIKSIVLPNSATLSSAIFYGCNDLESVVIPNIGFDLDDSYPNYYFGYLFGSDEPDDEANDHRVPTSLKTVVVTGDAAVGYMAFANCNNIETIRFTGNPVSLASNIFSGCTSLKTVIVPYIGGGTVNGISGGTEELGLIYEWNLTPITNIKTNPSTTAKFGYVNYESYDSTPDYSVGDIYIDPYNGDAYICTEVQDLLSEYGCWAYTWEQYTGDTGYTLPHKENGYWYVGTTNTGFAVGSSYNSVSYGNGDPNTYGAYIDDSPWYQTPYVDMDTGNFYGITSHTYGNNGDLYYRTDENILYRKYNDAWHVENAFGNVATGDVAPDNANGNDGDQYINIATGDFYRKDAGVWELESNLKDQFSKFGYWFSAFTNLVGIPKSLETVEIIGNITEIKDNTFMKCETIEELILPDSIITIGDHAFESCYGLKTINMPSSLKTIGDYAFNDCANLNISYIGNVNSIGESAFSYCGIRSLCLYNIGEIKTNAFSGCLVTDLILVDTEKIGAGAFIGCASLKTVDIETSGGHINLEIGDYAFQSCSSLNDFQMITNVSIKSLGTQAFMDCVSLRYIDLSLLECDISVNAFHGCASLNYVVISDSVHSIGNAAFDGCSSLVYVEIGAGVNSIGDFAFRNCISLATLNIKSTQAMTIGINSVFKNCYSLSKIIYAGDHARWTTNFYDQLGSLGNKDWINGVSIKCSDESFIQA